MKNWKNRIAIAISIVMLAAAGAVVDAGTSGEALDGPDEMVLDRSASFTKPDERRHPFVRRIMNRIAAELGLTDAQKQEIKGIVAAERSQVEPLLRQLAATRQQLRAASRDGSFDEAQVRTLAEQQSQTITELIVARERVKSKIYHVLTPEQRAKAEGMRQKFEARVRERIEKRMAEQSGK
jgi:Spy/CpxP family protein refolding chaperone